MARKDLTPTQSQVDQNEPTGWADRAQTTLAYNPSTRTVTLTAGASGAVFYSGAKRFQLAPSEVKTATHNNTTGIHFFFFDNSTTFVAQDSPWSIDTTQVPVTAVYYNSDTGDGVYLEERHGIQMDGKTHRYLHFTQGTKVESGFAISGYDLLASVPSDGGNAVAIASGAISDEDLRSVVPAMTYGTNNYRVWYRFGVDGDWRWDTTSLPFTVGATYAQWNEDSGSGWVKTEMASDRWMNMWFAATPALTPNQGIIAIMGQRTFADLPSAIAEDLHDVNFGELPFTEFASLYKVTFRSNSSYTSTGKVRVEEVEKIIGQNIISTIGHNNTQHNDLTGRDGANSHPATAISVDTATFNTLLSGSHSTVQLALNALDDHVHGLYVGPTPPSTPTTGTLWIDDTTMNLYVYYDSSWVEVLSSGSTSAEAVAYVSSTAPSLPVEGSLWFDIDDDKFYIYEGSAWTQINGMPSFSTVAVPLGSNPVADTISDTLTFTSTNGMLITGNASTDSIEFSTNATPLNTASTIVSRDADQAFDITAIDFDTADTIAGAVGRLSWNNGEGTLDLGLKGGNVTLQIGQEQIVLCKNDTLSSIPDGSVVYITGAAGQRPTIALAQANSESTSAYVFGVATETIAAGSEGFVTTFGIVRGINTSAFLEGTALWLSESVAGAMTTVKPSAPNHLVQVGFCVRQHATSGEIFVRNQNGYELDELHDVLIVSKQNNDVISYDSTAGVWKNRALLDEIKEVDGASSGIDADLLDGQHGTYYLDWTNVTNKPDPTVTLSGDITGSATMTDLGSINIATTNTGVKQISGTANQISASASTGSVTLSLPSAVTFPGTVTLNADPINPLEAATKQYVDGVAQGLNVHDAADVATTANITNFNSPPASIDGVTLTSGMRVLVKNQSTTSQNGIYSFNGSILSRATDYDSAGEVASGDFIFVTSGTLYANTGWVQQNNITTLGTDPISWIQFSGAGTYTAGNGLTLVGNEFALATSGVTAGTYNNSASQVRPFTVDNTGRITSIGTAVDIAIAQSAVTNLTTDLAAKAPLASPTFTGTVTIPTLAVTNTTLVTNLNADQLDGQHGTYYTEMTIPFTRSGALTVGSGATDFMWPFAVTILGISASISTAPTGSSVILDVDKNGTTIFTNQANRPTIAASATSTAAEVTNMDVTSYAAGDKIRVNIDQIGSTIAGSNLTVTIRYRRA